MTFWLRFCIGLFLLAGLWLHGYHVGSGKVEVQLASLRADIDRQVSDAQASARAVENRRVVRLKEAQDAEFIAGQAARRDADAARAAADRLRDRAKAVAAASCPAGDPGVTTDGSPGPNGPSLLADVLGSLAERADKLAEQADRARIAGQLCERAYDALTER